MNWNFRNIFVIYYKIVFPVIKNNYFYTQWTLKSNRIQRMLYDHNLDPDETSNLAIHERYQKIIASLSQELKLFKTTFN